MAKYVIKEDDSSEGLAAGAIILVFALLFILSPSIVITSLIYYIIDSMTIGQLWGTSIVGSLAVLGIICWKGGTIKNYLICSAIIGFLILLITLFYGIEGNIFIETLKDMIGYSSENSYPY